MMSTADEQRRSSDPFTVVGTRPLRHDGLDKVTGHARYGADVHLPGLRHGKVLRSPLPGHWGAEDQATHVSWGHPEGDVEAEGARVICEG